jgi:microcystin-dependent protein
LQQGRGPGLSDWRLGEKGGQERVSLTLANLPNHNHMMFKQDITVTSQQKAFNDEGTTEEPDGAFPALIDGKNVYASEEDGLGQPATVHVGNTLAATNTGAGQSFDIHSPYTAVNFIICLQGVFPSRN